MKFLGEFTISVKKGYLPHVTNELYKRKCEILKMSLVQSSDESDIFTVRIVYSSGDKFHGFIDKIEKHSDNFEILEIHHLLEESIFGGLLRVTGKLPVENSDDYQINVHGAADLIIEKAYANSDDDTFIGIRKNVALVNGMKRSAGSDREIFLKQYVMAERDAVIISRFVGLNAFPLVMWYDQVEDIIRCLKSIEDTFSVIRINYLEDNDVSVYEQIYKDISVPLLIKPFDEAPLFLLTVILSLLEKNGFDIKENNIGIIGIDINAIRLARLLNIAGCKRILGCDTSEILMLGFEKEGGLATTADNIFSNSDVILIIKDYFTIDEFFKIRPGQMLLSLIDETEFDMDVVQEKGLREFLHGNWMDLSVLFPGIIRGLVESGLRLDDKRLVEIAREIVKLFEGSILPDMFSDIHEKMAELIMQSRQTN